MAAKFEPIQKYKLYNEKNDNKKEIKYVVEGNVKYELDEEGNKIPLDLYKATDFEEVVEFLTKNGTDKDRKEFKTNCYLAMKKQPSGKVSKTGKVIMEPVKDSNGNVIMEITDKLNWLYAKQKFFEKFAPEYIPVAKEKTVPKHKLIENW